MTDGALQQAMSRLHPQLIRSPVQQLRQQLAVAMLCRHVSWGAAVLVQHTAAKQR